MERPDRAAGSPRAWILLAAVALLGLSAFWLLRPRGGLLGAYFATDPSGREVLVHAQVDRTVDFPSVAVLASPYFQHWDPVALGVPRSLPPFRVRWSGFVRARAAGVHRFRVETAGQARLLVDGRPVSPAPAQGEAWAEASLQAGWHRVELSYARGDEEPGIRLTWAVPGSDSAEVVPRGDTAPSEAALRSRLPRTLLGGAVLAAAAALLLWMWRTRGNRGAALAVLWNHRHGAALAAAVLLGLALRWHQYDVIPFHHETADEYQHGWEGWTLLHEGAPAAWTFYPHRYPPEKITPFVWFGDSYYLARPYFDHPPGFSLLVGAACSVLGAEGMLECTLSRMRVVPVLLGGGTILLLGWVGWRLLPRPLAGTLAALLFATLPTVVLGNRLVKAENLLAPLMLCLTLFLAAYSGAGRGRDIAKIVATCAAALWAKATGIALPLAAVLILAKERKGRAVFWVVLGAGAALAAYLAYGALYDWGLFVKVLGFQASKRVAIRTLLDLTGISRIVELQFGGGWYLWLALAASWMALGKHRALLVPPAVYLAVLALTADVRGVFGWYRLPLLPYLCLAGGWFLAEWWEAKDVGRGFLFCVTALATTLAYALPPALEVSRTTVLILIALAGALPAWALIRPTPPALRARNLAVLTALVLFFGGNLWIVARQVPIYLREGARGKIPVVAPASPTNR